MKIYVVISHCIEEDYTDGYFLHKQDAEKQLALTIEKEKDKLRERNNKTKELNKQIGLKNIYSGLINNIDKLSFNWEVEEIDVNCGDSITVDYDLLDKEVRG